MASLLFAQCQYSNKTESLGIGLVEYDNYNHREPIVEIFNNSSLTNLFYSWKLYDEQPVPFCAKFHKPDYGIAEFVVLDSTSKNYKILINEKDIKYIPRNINYVFWTWDDYLIQSHGIRRKREPIEYKTQTVRSEPIETSTIVELPNERHELFCVLEVKGDWIKIRYDCFYNKSKNPHEGMPCSTYINECENSIIGWLKWRDNSEILIDIFTMA